VEKSATSENFATFPFLLPHLLFPFQTSPNVFWERVTYQSVLLYSGFLSPEPPSSSFGLSLLKKTLALSSPPDGLVSSMTPLLFSLLFRGSADLFPGAFFSLMIFGRFF